VPKVEVEPVLVEQPPFPSRQQRRAAEREAAKDRERENKRLAIEALAKFKKARKADGIK
jgi:hypothetical protein